MLTPAPAFLMPSGDVGDTGDAVDARAPLEMRSSRSLVPCCNPISLGSKTERSPADLVLTPAPAFLMPSGDTVNARAELVSDAATAPMYKSFIAIFLLKPRVCGCE